MTYINKRIPLYYEIYKDLAKRIEQKYYQYGEFLPSERTLSMQYQVERATLRKSLALLQQQNYIEKIPGAGSKVIYKQPLSLNSNVMNTIIYVLPDMGDESAAQPYHMEICNHLEKYCKSDNLDLIFTKLTNTETVPSFLLKSAPARGIIWVGDIHANFLEMARNQDIPSIAVSNDYPHFPRINTDDIGCGYEATAHLIERGCKRIAHITGFPNYISAANRTEGYKRALLVHGLEPDPKLIVQGDWNFTSGYLGITQLIENNIPFDGIMASNDMMALGAIKAVIQAGLKIPEDIKVIGIDNIEQSKFSTPSLTTICVEQKSIARLAYLFLKQIMCGIAVPDEILIPGKLIKRETT